MYTQHVDSQYLLPWGYQLSNPKLPFIFFYFILGAFLQVKTIGYIPNRTRPKDKGKGYPTYLFEQL
jgi:hypothetical protein